MSCLHFWRLLRRIARREAGAWDDLNQHINACPICLAFIASPPPEYDEGPQP